MEYSSPDGKFADMEEFADVVWTAHPIGGPFPHVRCVYMFGQRQNHIDGIDNKPVYIGVAENLAERMQSHERVPEALGRGADTVFITYCETDNVSQQLEQRLIKELQPTLNTRHR